MYRNHESIDSHKQKDKLYVCHIMGINHKEGDFQGVAKSRS